MKFNIKKLHTIIVLLILLSHNIFGTENEAKASLKKAQQFVKNKDLISAEQEFKNAIEQSPEEGKYPAEYGKFLYSIKKDYKEAINYFTIAESKNFISPWLFRFKGISLEKLEQNDTAFEYLKKALDESKIKYDIKEKNADKEFTQSTDSLIRYLYKMEKILEAIPFAENILSIIPEPMDSSFLTITERIFESGSHIYFGNKDFANAEKYLLKAISINELNSKNKKQEEVRTILQTELELFQKRKNINENNFETTYKILIVFIPRTKLDFTSLKGEPLKSELTITEIQKSKTKWLAQAFARYWEALSDGKIKVEIDYYDSDTTLVSLDQRISKNENTSGGEIRAVNPETSFSPSLSDLFQRNYKETDSFIFIWNGTGVATYANGGSKKYPLENGNMITRGYVHISVDRFNEVSRPQLYLHEMFHNIESITKNNLQIDGKELSRKKAFPGCPALPEIDFFKCHFDKTLPEIFQSDMFKDKGWKNFNFKLQYTNPKSGQNNREIIDKE